MFIPKTSQIAEAVNFTKLIGNKTDTAKIFLEWPLKQHSNSSLLRTTRV